MACALHFPYREGEIFVWGPFRRGNFHEGKIAMHLQFCCRPIRHGDVDTSNPSVLVDNQLCETLAQISNLNQAHKHSRRRPTSHSQASKMNPHSKWTDCRKQHNNTWLPWPLRMHKEQEASKLREKLWGNFRHQTEKRSFPHEFVPCESPPPPAVCSRSPCALFTQLTGWRPAIGISGHRSHSQRPLTHTPSHDQVCFRP